MDKNNLVVGLYGISGVYNYGCEAIVRGTEKILRDMWPEVQIIYASMRPEDDKKRLKGLNIEIIPRTKKPMGTAERLSGTLAYKTGLYFKNLFYEDLSWTEECEAIFSIGGDLYTLPGNYKDTFKPYYDPIVHFGQTIKSKNKKYIIWGASIGPFKGKAKNYYVKHLKNVDMITSREPVTSRYLKDLGFTNVINFPDPAFRLKEPSYSKKETKSKEDKIIIGLNLSPYSAAYMGINKNIELSLNLIRNLVEKFNANVILIPHVVSDFNKLDDDLRYLKTIYDFLTEDLIGEVELIENDPGYLGIRDTLKSCDLMIASRMHCGINAISHSIPTIFLSYSQKSVGMSEYIYSDDKYVYPLNKTDELLFFYLIENIITKKKDIRKFLSRRLEDIHFKSNFPLKYKS